MTFRNRYGIVDRLLHRVAFATGFSQAAIADIEDRLFARDLSTRTLDAPVLITGLPRAGTTILLELLAATPTFASHTYRDMPFILCPMMWDKISKPFQKSVTPLARVHDDGIAISPDSPEAFEEILWMRFWPERYRGSSIPPWKDCRNEEFIEFFESHMRKIVALRARTKPAVRRYVSKNNLNIARIPAIWDILPAAVVVVPFREPLQHAASLLRQHQRFTALHAEDPFAQRYMTAIGHFDFGANLKPVNFDGWLDGPQSGDPNRVQFWLDYWLATYRYVLRHRNRQNLVLVDFEALGSAADTSRLSAALGMQDPGELQSQVGILKPARPHAVVEADVSPKSTAAARAIHEELRALSVL